jgi:hypothetical protein
MELKVWDYLKEYLQKKVLDLIDQIKSGKFTFQNKRNLHKKMVSLYGIDAVKKQMSTILNTPDKLAGYETD